MKLAELKEQCKSRGLKVSGKKAQLIERLEAAMAAASEEQPAAPVEAEAPAESAFHVGQKVEGYYEDDEEWYPGKVESDNGDGTFVVAWDDSEGGPESSVLAADNIRAVGPAPAAVAAPAVEAEPVAAVAAAPAAAVAAAPAAAAKKEGFSVGQEVEALYPDDEEWYTGKLTKDEGGGSWTITWDDPDGGPESHVVKEENIKAIEVPTFQVDDTVEAVYPDDENWYTGVVKEVKGDDAYVVAWDDSDGGPESSTVKATDMRAYVKRIPLKDLQRKQKMKGTVTSIREFGAFVDVGAERDGLVHVSNMPRVPDLPYQADDYVEALFKDEENGDEWYTGTMKEAKEDGTYVVEWDDPGDGDATSIVKGDEIRLHQPRCAVAEGDEIDVWVRDVQAPREEGMDWRLGLTMFEKSPLTAFEEVPANQWIKGKVVRAASFGAFVEITAPNGMVSTGLCHVSQMRDGYVENAEDEVEIGSEVNVRVLSVDLDRERISLSFKDDNYGGGYEDDGGY